MYGESIWEFVNDWTWTIWFESNTTTFEGFYKEKLVGDYIADVIVEDKIIVELKSIENLNKTHEVQLVNYLKAVNMEVGLLLNFGKEKLEFKRKVLNLWDLTEEGYCFIHPV